MLFRSGPLEKLETGLMAKDQLPRRVDHGVNQSPKRADEAHLTGFPGVQYIQTYCCPLEPLTESQSMTTRYLT